MTTTATATAPLNMDVFLLDAAALGVPTTMEDVAAAGACMCCLWAALGGIAAAAGDKRIAARADAATLILGHSH